jgi:hypothetical protein
VDWHGEVDRNGDVMRADVVFMQAFGVDRPPFNTAERCERCGHVGFAWKADSGLVLCGRHFGEVLTAAAEDSRPQEAA